MSAAGQSDQKKLDDTPRKRQHSFWLDQQLYESFQKMVRMSDRNSVSAAMEEAMIEWMGRHRDEMPIQTVINIIDAKTTDLSLTTRLELKTVKADLTKVIKILEEQIAKNKGSKATVEGTGIIFWKKKLGEILPKAIRLYQRTSDSELAELLKKADELI